MNNDETLWMGDLESWMNESFIMNSFNEYGFEPINVKLIIDTRANKKQNFCFVKFNTLQEANNALFKLNGKKIPKTNCFFKLNLTKKSSKNQKIIFVGNLPDEIGDNELYLYFKSNYSSVISASIITNEEKSLGYGFVHFTDEDEYQKCLKEMDGKLFNNEKIKIRKKINLESINNKYKNFLNWITNNKFNYKQPSYQENLITKKHNYFIDKGSTYMPSQDNKKNTVSLNRIDNKKEDFLANRKLLENNNNVDLKKLKAKIQEVVDKMFEYYKNSNKMCEIPSTILYYCSSQNL